MANHSTTTHTIEQAIAFARAQGWNIERGAALQGDVSSRLYCRLYSGFDTWIICRYPHNQWFIAERFLASTEILAAAGIRVPAVLAADPSHRMMLLEDLGESPWYVPGAQYQDSDRAKFARSAEIVAKIRRLDLSAQSSLLPPLDASVLATELETTLEHLLFSGDPAALSIRRTLEIVCGQVIDTVSALPLEPAHRDFMVRNLVPMADGNIGVIDHQDLRLAPMGYDFVSLMNDSLFPPHQVVDSIQKESLPKLGRAAYSALGAQRTLKAVGSYARAATQGNPSHQRLIVPTLHRFVDHLEALPETHEHGVELRSDWLTDLVF